MSEINLLPWREDKRRRERKRAIITLSGITLGTVSTIFSMHLYTLSLLSKQSQHNQQLEEETTRFARQIQEIDTLEEESKRLISRIIIIRNLALSRPLLVHLFNELIRVLPDDVYLAGVKKTNDSIRLIGYSATSQGVVSLMRNLEKSALVKAPILIEIKKRSVDKMNNNHEFTVNFKLREPQCVYTS